MKAPTKTSAGNDRPSPVNRTRRRRARGPGPTMEDTSAAPVGRGSGVTAIGGSPSRAFASSSWSRSRPRYGRPRQLTRLLDGLAAGELGVLEPVGCLVRRHLTVEDLH